MGKYTNFGKNGASNLKFCSSDAVSHVKDYVIVSIYVIVFAEMYKRLRRMTILQSTGMISD